MAFWIGILIGGAFAWYAIKLRLYQTWALTFNIIISIYLAIYLRPVIAAIPVVGDTSYSNILTMVVISAASFLILQGISYTFLTGQFNVSFPKVLDTLGAGFLGFLAGFLVWSFLSLLIYLTPASQNALVEGIGFKNEFQGITVSYISRFCNLINSVAAEDNKSSAEQTINKLLKSTKSKMQSKKAKPEKPIEPAEPNEAEIGTEEQLGPPPEIDLEDI